MDFGLVLVGDDWSSFDTPSKAGGKKISTNSSLDRLLTKVWRKRFSEHVNQLMQLRNRN